MGGTPAVRVLLIDDDEDDFFLTRDLLGDIPNGGFELEWVSDYDAALEAVGRGAHDVYLLDYRLGRRTGLDLLREARQRGYHPAVIFLTGQGEREVDVAAMEAGALDYLEKGHLNSATLERAIRYTLLQKRQADELERKVQERTADLARANRALQAEIITRRQVSEALHDSEARFRHLADAMPQIVWIIAADGTLEYINRRWTEYTGLTLEETRDRERVQEVLYPGDQKRIDLAAARGLRERVPYQVEFRLKRAGDGVYRWFLGRGVPVLDEQGEIVRWYGTSTDINDQKKAEEELREADRRKTQFLATLAHELRSPLPPIRNALEIMRLAHNEPDAVERGRAMIERQIKQLVRLIDDLLDLSRISRGKIELRKERIDAATVVQSAVETSQPLLDAAEHHLTVALPPEPLFLDADPTRLAQVLINLLTNAAKYTDPGGRIWLRASREGDRAVFSVRDTGIGLAADQIPRIFEMFTQVGRSEERSQGGLGIGLWLVRSLVELHGGSVEVRSDGPGQGSEFILRLPLEIPRTKDP
jgi:PAS domain S-box-containing protein